MLTVSSHQCSTWIIMLQMSEESKYRFLVKGKEYLLNPHIFFFFFLLAEQAQHLPLAFTNDHFIQIYQRELKWIMCISRHAFVSYDITATHRQESQ